MKNSILILLSFILISSIKGQSIELFKKSGDQKISSKSFIYALPQTSVTVTVEATKTTILRGKYAEYAQKYLKLSGVPMKDTAFWTISDVKADWQAEADPSQTFLVSVKIFPAELNRLFSLSGNGLILDFGSSAARTEKSSTENKPLYFDPYLVQKTSKEKIDTFYKTLMTDTSIVKVPIFKKQVQAKNTDDYAKEAASELIKTRKRTLKILRGEYDFHPDGAALKVMVEELKKYEEQLLELFAGKAITEKQYVVFTVVPKSGEQTFKLGSFTAQNGVSRDTIGNTLVLNIIKQQQTAKGIDPVKAKKILYLRAPVMSDINVQLGDKNLFSSRIPVYQFGPVVTMPIR